MNLGRSYIVSALLCWMWPLSTQIKIMKTVALGLTVCTTVPVSLNESPPSTSQLDFSKRTSIWIGLYAVKVRAEAMQEASEAVPSGMLSVLGQRQSNFSFACLEAQEHCKSLGIENPVCQVSNYLFPDCRVISGHLEVSVDGSYSPRLQSIVPRGVIPCVRMGALLSIVWRPRLRVGGMCGRVRTAGGSRSQDIACSPADRQF